jgi:UDP-N-acetyl-D-mannosaminuronic acid transferase (WecB/TagA/CpsF family)
MNQPRAVAPVEQGDQDKLIRQAEPHSVWVGLGTPKQEFEVWGSSWA